jgi:hypothetical protein
MEAEAQQNEGEDQQDEVERDQRTQSGMKRKKIGHTSLARNVNNWSFPLKI